MKKLLKVTALLFSFLILAAPSYFSGLEITNISSSPASQSSIYIKWELNTNGSSQIEYGETTDYGNLTQLTNNKYTTIDGLNFSDTYHYRIKSYCCQGMGAAISEDYTFNLSDYIWPIINSASPQPLTSVDDTITIYGENFNYGDNRCLDCDGLRQSLGIEVMNWTDTSVQFKFDEEDWHYTSNIKDDYKCKIQVAIGGAPDYYSNEINIDTEFTPECELDDWSCENWSDCSSNGIQTRTCSKTLNCEGGTSSPVTSQSCTYINPEITGSFELILPDNREQGVMTQDKILIEYYGSSIITKVYLNSTELSLGIEDFYSMGGYPVLNYQLSSFYVPSWATDGEITVSADEKTKNIGNITIYNPPIDCSFWGNAHPGSDDKCYCDSGYKWNNNKSRCILESIVEEEEEVENEKLDSDNDGVPDENDFYPYTKSEIITKNYSFNYKMLDENEGKLVNFTINIPKDLYYYYLNKNHTFTEQYNNIPEFITDDDISIKDIVDQINQLKEKENFNYLALVYQLIEQIIYTDDIFSIKGWNEYPKYPVETILDGKGDCEDTAFLTTSLLKALGSIPMLVRFDNHLGVAVTVTNDIYDSVVYKYGEDYLADFNNELIDRAYKLIYIETTSNNVGLIGYMPEELRNKKYTIQAPEQYKRNSTTSGNTTSGGGGGGGGLDNSSEQNEPTEEVDTNLSNRLKGKLLLQVNQGGRIWYVNPDDSKRFEVTFANALPLFENFALGISNSDLDDIPEHSDNWTSAVGNRLKGKLLLQVEDRGRIWYVDFNGKRWEVTWANLMELFESLSLGITDDDLYKIGGGEL